MKTKHFLKYFKVK